MLFSLSQVLGLAAVCPPVGDNVRPRTLLYETARTHIFTHVEWDMRCYCFACGERAEGFFWAEPAALEGEVALPTAFRKFLNGISQ